MQTLTRQIIDLGLANHIITDAQLGRVVEGSQQRRYHLANRAMRAGELIRLKRGIYTLADEFRDYSLHPFTFAQSLEPGSYISLETALSYHGWIPEGVYTTASILPGRKVKEYEHEKFGYFTFHPLATNKGYFLELVGRLKINEQTMLVAEPIRALMDLVCLRKMKWQGIGWLIEGLRIDLDYLRKTTSADIRILKEVYKHKQVKEFLNALARELGND